ncbi:MAG: Zn-ribbon domain-containing OB-fold protein [Bacteroidales bacterium]
MFSWFGKVSYCPHTKVSQFADLLKTGRLAGSRCLGCGFTSFPPRADCPKCLSGEFAWVEMSGRGTILTWTRIDAAPAGFEDLAPYTIGVVDLEETGRLLAWFGTSIAQDEIRAGMEVQVVPRLFEEIAEIKVYYTLERPATTWFKEPLPSGATMEAAR